MVGCVSPRITGTYRIEAHFRDLDGTARFTDRGLTAAPGPMGTPHAGRNIPSRFDINGSV